ncbi:MAG: hypothetical protein RLZZ163_1340 [Actinomycetota bacterium]|jgi:hypothetical protein
MMTDITDPCPLVFVHLGDRFPRFAAANVRMAVRHSRLPVWLVTDAPVESIDLAAARVIPIDSSWYDGGRMARFSRRTLLDGDFRNGFWLKTVERFFVLEAIMPTFGLRRLLHAELDVVVSDLSTLMLGLLDDAAALHLPFPLPDRVIASLVHVNRPEGLRRLCDWIVESADYRNEMQLLADFVRHDPMAVTMLPTDAALDVGPNDWRSTLTAVSPATIGGIVDANAMGHWLFGSDPRNHTGPSWNRLGDRHSQRRLSRLTFEFDRDGVSLLVRTKQDSIQRVLALHVHAKVHDRLERGRLQRRVLRNLQRGRPTLIRAGVPLTIRRGRTALPSRWASRIRAWRFRGL